MLDIDAEFLFLHSSDSFQLFKRGVFFFQLFKMKMISAEVCTYNSTHSAYYAGLAMATRWKMDTFLKIFFTNI